MNEPEFNSFSICWTWRLLQSCILETGQQLLVCIHLMQMDKFLFYIWTQNQCFQVTAKVFSTVFIPSEAPSLAILQVLFFLFSYVQYYQRFYMLILQDFSNEECWVLICILLVTWCIVCCPFSTFLSCQIHILCVFFLELLFSDLYAGLVGYPGE